MRPDVLLQDFKHAVRQVIKERWLTTAAVIALALGLGVSTTIMTVLYGWFAACPSSSAAHQTGARIQVPLGLGVGQ
jgi:hypothetical protein